MARKPMISRTIKTTLVSVMAVNVVEEKTFNDTIILPRTFKDENKLMEKVKEAFDTPERKAVAITAKDEVETLYGMTEDDFIANSVKLDPETRKPVEA